MVWFVCAVWPRFFDLELTTIRYLVNARRSEAFRAELDSYRAEYRNHGGFLRNTLGVRLSGNTLTKILTEVSPEGKNE